MIAYITRVNKNGSVDLVLQDNTSKAILAACTVVYRPERPQGHPERYQGLPRFLPQVRETAKIAVRKALAA